MGSSPDDAPCLCDGGDCPVHGNEADRKAEPAAQEGVETISEGIVKWSEDNDWIDLDDDGPRENLVGNLVGRIAAALEKAYEAGYKAGEYRQGYNDGLAARQPSAAMLAVVEAARAFWEEHRSCMPHNCDAHAAAFGAEVLEAVAALDASEKE